MKSRPKKPPIPSQKDDTIRHGIVALLTTETVTALDISREIRVAEHDVYDHLEHIRKTVRSAGRQLVIVPAECMECGFVFHKRARLTKPGKCPVCRGSHISEPQYFIGEDVD